MRDEMSPRVSRSTLTTCCWWATTRILRLVWRFPSRVRPDESIPLLFEDGLQLGGGGVIAHDAQQFGPGTKLGDIPGDIPRAAGHETLATIVHHRDGCLGGDSGNITPKEVVEHDVSDDDHAGLCKAAGDGANRGRVRLPGGLHRGRFSLRPWRARPERRSTGWWRRRSGFARRGRFRRRRGLPPRPQQRRGPCVRDLRRRPWPC